jgi:hypothetical protein
LHKDDFNSIFAPVKKLEATRKLNTTDENCGTNALGLPLGHFYFK